jgi:CheY-like chemotaxis protein
MARSLGRILVVDDEPRVAEMLRDLLVDFGYVVKVALGGVEALNLVPVYQPDAVLLDISMPEVMSGVETLEHLRRLDPELPVVMLTANTDVEIARGTLTRGAFDYIPKPFNLEVLERVVAAAVLRRGREQRRPTVLYIEDNLANIQLIERLLEQRPGVQLLPATDGRRGLALARERRPDLILLDLHLPDMEGEDLLRVIRLDPDLERTPVIILSGEAHAGLPEQMRAAGAQGFLVKPLDFQQFFAEVDAALAR